ncbi:winged helix-turn-helix domain-containing protein [uncultured Gulosibacter sp.]|uniref:winged helix-turn-helix domain-containing protein n=1 Tax=uncultured Gulosibacter sp. TaxID=1339167 RepID=UPI0028891A2A|nr:winged helix-turn-helix domain-containing protein [uncultured Gulosibacter sp.]
MSLTQSTTVIPHHRTDQPRLRPTATAAPATGYTAAARQPAPTARGFALYVGLDTRDDHELAEIVNALREVLTERAPDAESYASVALAPAEASGRPIDLVRLALQEPKAVAEARSVRNRGVNDSPRAATKVVIDTSRKRVLVHDDNADLTYKEFELLQALVLREGRTVTRDELIDVLWTDRSEEQPHERTIDVHVRRLRKKLGDYADIVRTVRGSGYRFDRHADVRVVHPLAPSPDRF